jgi:hypothetical protein
MLGKHKKRLKEEVRNYLEQSYFLYKVCEGCDSLVHHTVCICPKCNAYRFNTDYRQIVQNAMKKFDSSIEDLCF